MKTPPAVFCASICLLFCREARAQVYAPDTEYHDRSQRRFAVEMARVEAWREKSTAAEITYEVTSAPGGKTEWKIHWLDAAGKPVRDFAISYDEKALVSGPAFYRGISASFLGAPSSKRISEKELAGNFWAGAEMGGVSRMESVRAAFALKPADGAGAAKLAGLLLQAAAPSLGGGVSLDSTLLARSAAWLCVAESLLDKPPRQTDALWAPILFLSKRENAAKEIWEKAGVHPDTAAAKWWGFLLSQPGSYAAFLSCAEPANRKFAMAMLAYESTVRGEEMSVPDSVRLIFKNDASVAALHDYGPFFAHCTGVDGGNMADGAWPVYSREAWLQCLREFKPEPLDFQGYKDALARCGQAEAQSSQEDPSLAGLAEAAPLINLGFSEGTGKLTPAGIVTARDLLNFGWEMNGAQMGARWEFVLYDWGIQEQAEAIAKSVLGAIDGAEAFLIRSPYHFQARRPPENWKFIQRTRVKDFSRLQEIEPLTGTWVVPTRTFSPDKGTAAILWMRRCWLRPPFILDQSRELYFANKRRDITPLLRRQLAEGGPLILSAETEFFVVGQGLDRVGVTEVPGSDALRLDLVQSAPEPTTAQLGASWGRFSGKPPFETAQEMEKLFWKRPGSHFDYSRVFSDYVAAHAYESAKRFYDQIDGVIDERVGFSNGIGPRRFTLALMENDQPGMIQALKDSETASYSDMVLNIVAAAAMENYEAMETQVNECMERYPASETNANGEEDMMRKLKAFIPLIPALKDPANPDHGKALDFFQKYQSWPTLQWVLIQKAKLPPEEAVRFLGGKDTDPERRMLVAYLLKDKKLFQTTFDLFKGEWKNMAFVCIHYLRNELLDVPAPREQPDLKPPNAQSLTQALAARVAQVEAARVSSQLDKYKTADRLWEYIDKLATGEGEQSAERLRELAAACAEFSRRYAKDPRRWKAKFLSAQLLPALAQMDNKEADPSAQEAALKEIADASGAPAGTREEARFSLLVLRLQNEEVSPDLDKQVDAFEKDYPDGGSAPRLRLAQAESWQDKDRAKAAAILERLEKNPDEKAAHAARARLQMLGVKPLELKFTALDGVECDLAKLRGKVALIDFWATWCGPCMAEVPEVVATYQKLHDKGFEIVGVSLDQDKESVLKVTRAKGMTWRQYFDGKGWENDVAKRFGIHGIPAMWLVNKKGFVVDLEAREDLGAKVEKLLAE